MTHTDENAPVVIPAGATAGDEGDALTPTSQMTRRSTTMMTEIPVSMGAEADQVEVDRLTAALAVPKWIDRHAQPAHDDGFGRYVDGTVRREFDLTSYSDVREPSTVRGSHDEVVSLYTSGTQTLGQPDTFYVVLGADPSASLSAAAARIVAERLLQAADEVEGLVRDHG